MNEYEELKQFAIEADARGDIEAATMAMDKMEAIQQSQQQPEQQPPPLDFTQRVIQRAEQIKQAHYGNNNNPTTNNLGGIDVRRPDRYIEPALTIGSSMVAEPVAGVAGIVQSLNPFAETGAGERAIESTREALTYTPKTEEGMQGLQAVGETIAPVAEKLSDAEKYLGDNTFEYTGSPTLAAAAATVPTAFMELIGFKSGKALSKIPQATKKAAKQSQALKAIYESAPSAEQLKATARGVYKELDNLGVSIREGAYNGLLNKLNIVSKQMGVDPDITPKALKALNRFQEMAGKSPTLSELDTLRKIAQSAAKSLEPAEAAAGVAIINAVDGFMDNIRPSALTGVDNVADVSKRYKIARDLWGRSRRSEMIGEAFEKARLQASGFENGIRIQFRQILNNKKKRRFFNTEELIAMKRVVEGTKKENIARLIGKLGFSEGSATQLIGGSLGVAAGATLGGAPGAVAVPLIGQVSKKLAQRMTAKNAEFADQVIRAGSNAELITKAYQKHTPKALQSAEDLSELLMKPDIDLSILNDELGAAAARIATQRRAELAGVTAASGSVEEDK